MVFIRMRSAFGAGAPSVATFLTRRWTQPGGTLSGEIRLRGGDFDAAIDRIGLGLAARLGPLKAAGDRDGIEEFCRPQISGPAVLPQGAERAIEFRVAVPWETPISEIGGRHLTGLALAVQAEVAIDTAVGRGDAALVAVRPVPSQLRVLQAFARLGFPFKSAALRAGPLSHVGQELPFHQRIEFYPPSHHAGVVHAVELSFVPSASGLDVLLAAGKATGPCSGGERFRMSHEEALRTDWPSEIDRWLARLVRQARGDGRWHRG
ncbi:sporulation protein [Nonomuraea jiangxiensis]|uniref:Sporulation-control protein n=1 Tax=Nonomuraea jiangxiensis TaxID=633440 RepID=A0A1G8DHU6_9ACTN|nr:sporulation protein [Nonomuraea jiangxiensis]SDH57288.1 sporulation-control protein [Nonomuraea jiangxiensis]